MRAHAGVLLDRVAEVLVGEGQHPAVGVVDEDDLGRPEQPLADRERADLVVGDHAAGVADDVRLALVEAEHAVDVEAGVHAGQDGDVLGRRQGERAGEGLGVAGVVLEQFVGDGHGGAPDLIGLVGIHPSRPHPARCVCRQADQGRRDRPGDPAARDGAAGRHSPSNAFSRRLGQKASSPATRTRPTCSADT
ncbi:hypothetical protein GGQ55_001884 [Geodermatophilus daqingensis]|uniref:Uncharacterized protein n=1 Tax=Petropleomorpha daqingensis TaxID=2026353 RepID=A0A853CEL9_9ACTN|nr:hypothetical protein [Petropleomorpha daqingensis]